MLIVGLTGSIGMGKSTVANRLRELGIPVCDADTIVHNLYKDEAVPAIKKAFPGVIENGQVDRSKLSAWLMEKPEDLQQLERIIHPMVRKQERAFLKAQTEINAPLAVLEIPLLFETGANKLVDVTVVVSTSPQIQEERVLTRPGMTREKFYKLRARQLSNEEKCNRADFVLDNNGTIEEMFAQVDAMIEKLREKKGQAYQRHWT